MTDLTLTGIQAVVMDIEGTTTDLAFVHDVLFPYAKTHLPELITTFVTDPAATPYPTIIRQCLDQIKSVVLQEEGRAIDDHQCIDTLAQWMAIDRKQTALKTLQGIVWESGFNLGAFKGHVYDDVPDALKAWHAQGLTLAIYSSGSIQSQKLLFSNSLVGDLTPFLSAFFDTTTGPKQAAGSYSVIAEQLHVLPHHILFLSDVAAELDAAANAGFQVAHVVRDARTQASHHPSVQTFNDLAVNLATV